MRRIISDSIRVFVEETSLWTAALQVLYLSTVLQYLMLVVCVDARSCSVKEATLLQCALKLEYLLSSMTINDGREGMAA